MLRLPYTTKHEGTKNKQVSLMSFSQLKLSFVQLFSTTIRFSHHKIISYKLFYILKMFDFLFKGPFINNLRIREGVTHVRTNANKGEGGPDSENVHKST